KRPLGRAEIGDAEADVRGDDADERHARKVVALRNHLRADEDVDLAAAKLLEQRVERALAADRIPVEPGDARVRANAGHRRLNTLGTESGLFQVRAGAERTLRRHARRVVAVVAARASGVALAVDDERDAAVRTVERPRALAAEDRRREAAPVQEDQRLLAIREALGDRAAERAAHDHVAPARP